MKIELITMWYNEEFLAPFFLNHYSWIDRIHIILDADTNDNTELIARQYPNVEIEHFKFPDMMDDIIKVKKINDKYNTLTEADYVILVDSDEFIFCNQIDKPVRLHLENTRKDVYFVNLWQIYVHETDLPLEPNESIPYQRRHGDPNMNDPFNILYIKPAIVKGNKNIYWTPGNHELVYDGNSLLWKTRNIEMMKALNVSVERNEMLQGSHWRLVDLKETIRRRILNRKQRQSQVNLRKGLTYQYHHITEEEIIQEYNKNKNQPVVLLKDGFYDSTPIETAMTPYSGNRPDLIKYIPDNTKKILDVGCGEGGLGNLLKDSGRWEIVAIELNAEAAKKAEPYYNKVIVGDVQSIILPYPKDYFDCIVCGDVLEHLYNPWVTLRKLSDYLDVNGDIIISLPNIRHYKILKKLVIGGRWEYKASGILDRSHIRFFSLIEMEIMLQNAGLKVKHMQRVIRGRSYIRFLNKLLFGLFNDMLTEQYIFVARRT